MENYELKYKNALEWARQVMNGETGFIREEVEEVFPELAESKDESTRKSLILYLEYKRKEQEEAKYYQGVEGFERWINWIEKQGEPFDDNIITRDDEILQAISIGLTDAEKDLGWSDFGGLPIEEIKDWLEKQGEPKWSEEDERMMKLCTSRIQDELEALRNNNFAHQEILQDLKEGCRERIDWLESIKKRMED